MFTVIPSIGVGGHNYRGGGGPGGGFCGPGAGFGGPGGGFSDSRIECIYSAIFY